MPQLQLVLVTPETTLLDEAVDALRFPLFDGQIGILPGRAPMVGRLGYGELKIKRAHGEASYYVDGGFVQVKGSVVSLLTNRAVAAADVDAAEADALLDEARHMQPRNEEQFAARERNLERARRMKAVAQSG